MLDDRHVVHGCVKAVIQVFELGIAGRGGNPFFARLLFGTPVGRFFEVPPDTGMNARGLKGTQSRQVRVGAIQSGVAGELGFDFGCRWFTGVRRQDGQRSQQARAGDTSALRGTPALSAV